MDYEEAKQRARHPDPKVRQDLAAREDVRPEILYFLVDDSSTDVRKEIAGNHATPGQSMPVLARDPEVVVRQVVADRVAKLVPTLDESNQSKLQGLVLEALQILACDQEKRVRKVIAEAIKDVAGAPPDVIKRLAYDTELDVAAPVIEFSPVLTDEDLLDIINSGAVRGKLMAISRRSSVAEQVADALVASSDVEVIGELLDNENAQIREETLDALVDQASSITLWHRPLVHRPFMPLKAAARIAQFVATNLLEVLQRREDLDAETLKEIGAVVRRRLEEAPKASPKIGNRQDDGLDPSLTAIKKLHKEGRLDERSVAEAVSKADREFVRDALAVLSGVPNSIVQDVFASRRAKAVLAIVWKAGLSAALARTIQDKIAGVPLTVILDPTDSGEFPIAESEMSWQLELFSE